MNIEQQVVNLDLAKRLKELGVKQKSYFCWMEFRNISSPKEQHELIQNCLILTDEKSAEKEKSYLKNQKFYSAFTVAEFGEMLPPSINNWGLCFDATSCAIDNTIKNMWHITYADYDKKLMNEISDLNLANVFSKMLVYLLENKLLNPEKMPKPELSEAD